MKSANKPDKQKSINWRAQLIKHDPDSKVAGRQKSVDWREPLIQRDADWEVGEKIYCNWNSKGVFLIAKITKILQYQDEPAYTVHYTGYDEEEEVQQHQAYDRFMPVTEAYIQKSKAINEKVKKKAEKKFSKNKNAGQRRDERNECSVQDKTNVVNWGDMLPDDLINIFCERLSTSLKGRIEGMMAMQSIMIEPEQCLQAISGGRQVLQVLLDANISHYILVEWKNENRQVNVYDPLFHGISLDAVEKKLTLLFRQQIRTLFGHLFWNKAIRNGVTEKYTISIPIMMQRQMQRQLDGWSCGLRAIGHLLLLAFDRKIHEFNMDLNKLLKFFVRILQIHQPTAELFQDENLGKEVKKAKKIEPVSVFMDKSSLQLTLRRYDQQEKDDDSANSNEHKHDVSSKKREGSASGRCVLYDKLKCQTSGK